MFACADEPGPIFDEEGLRARAEAEQDLEPPSDARVLAAASIDNPAIHEAGWRYLPHTDRRLWVATVVNDRAEKALVGFDEDGEPVDLEPVIAEEQRAQLDACGKLGAELCERIGDGERKLVAIWLRLDEPEPDRQLTSKDPALFERDVARFEAAIGRRLAAIAPELERMVGAKLERSTTAPVLWAELDDAQLARIEASPEVGWVELTGGLGEDDLATAKTLTVWTTPGPEHDGTGVPVGVLEMDAPDDTTYLPSHTLRVPTDTTASHARYVTAVIANTGGSTATGFANEAQIHIANRSPADSEGDIDWAGNQGARAHNQSWHYGTEEISYLLSARDRYLDYNVRNYARFYALAAGNVIYGDGETDIELVNHKGYNLVTVGATYQDRTIVDGDNPDWCAPLTDPWTSTFRNPDGVAALALRQELPNISAPGSCLWLADGWSSGTSVASPVVTGIVAGLMEDNPALMSWPEAVKAILLASPTGTSNNSPDGCPWRYSSSTSSCNLLDGRDGTGLVNGARSGLMAEPPNKLRDNLASRLGHDYGFVQASQFTQNGNQFTSQWHARGGNQCFFFNRRLSVGLAWDSKVACTGTSCTDALEMDLDLLVYEEPGHTLIAQSSTTGNSYEYVNLPIRDDLSQCWPAGANWHYEIVVRLANKAAIPATASTYFGLAWQADPYP